MASEVTLPELGENLDEGEVLEVRVQPGDTVALGQTLLEIEAEKSTIEVPSPVAGRLAKLLVQKGETVKVGQALCLIEDGAAQKNGGTAKPKEKPAETESQIGPPAHRAKASESVRAPETPGPATTAATAPEPAEEPKGNGRKSERSQPPPSKGSSPGSALALPERLVPAGPATRRLARELGVDLRQVKGSGPSGRVTTEDVRGYVRQLASSAGAGTRLGAPPAPPLPDFSKWGVVERRPLEPVRRRTAETMSLAWSLIPQVTHFDEADVTDLEAFRRQQEGSGPKVTITAFALKAAASALKEFPQFNSSLDAAAGQLVLKRYYHIGVAVNTERGLLVPVLRDIDRKSVRELAREMAETAERARQNKVPVDELRGGTFTITNLGGIGGTAFSPIVNYPQVAILGLSRSRLQPVVYNGQIVPRLILPLCVSYDHRVIDGADAARFTRRIREMLENPLQMLL
jgi:pyruvate dehydrogenase E2 component (dihydrolipoamide acetyltransferase)